MLSIPPSHFSLCSPVPPILSPAPHTSHSLPGTGSPGPWVGTMTKSNSVEAPVLSPGPAFDQGHAGARLSCLGLDDIQTIRHEMKVVATRNFIMTNFIIATFIITSYPSYYNHLLLIINRGRLWGNISGDLALHFLNYEPNHLILYKIHIILYSM